MHINGRCVSWQDATIDFAQVVGVWKEHDPERLGITELPGIDWSANGDRGVLYRTDDPLAVTEDLAFRIDVSREAIEGLEEIA